LTAAAKCGHFECVEFLLDDRTFDTNAKNEHGQTALSLAVTHDHEKIVALLLKQQNIDPNVSDGRQTR
jgi:ankyrin repeat protein